MPSLAVLVATTRTQGKHGSDFAHVPDGELVDLAPACCCGEYEADLDGPCGNARAFQGLDSYRPTTTAEVAVRALTVVQYRNLFHRSLITAGYEDDQELWREAQEDADEMLDYAASWPPGTVLERRGRVLVVRARPTVLTGIRRDRQPTR
ncbi:DUF7715 family protein [Actinophytocola glycyrrhizae]|uniref:DUF7715 domain-containing protein n=1 Tax=Actinophytocola glycyrrhizae TaxID=2044873 RepID=A0ABV9SBX7_9PSEU